MSTNFLYDDLEGGDAILAGHINQLIQPIQDLESGAAVYRAASLGVDDHYEVDFTASANPNGNSLSSLAAGQVIVFKASHTSLADKNLTVLVEGGQESYPLYVGGRPLAAGEIPEFQIVAVVFNDATGTNETLPTRFDVMGVGQLTSSGTGGDEVGDLIYTYRDTPIGYLEANGQVVTQASYSALFAQVGLLGVIPADGISWTLHNQFGGLTGLTYGDGTWVALSTSGIATSVDGKTWSYQNITAFNDVTFGNGLFLACGINGYVYTSPDAVVWTRQISAATAVFNATLNGVTYGNGLYVVAGNSGRIATSPDGVNWTLRTNAPSYHYTSVSFANGVFMAGAGGSTTCLTRSTDGINWAVASTSSSYFSGSVWDAAYSPVLDKWVSGGGNRIMTSTDNGLTWVNEPNILPDPYCFLWLNDRFVAGCRSSNNIHYSLDGTNWTSVSPSSGYMQSMATDGLSILLVSSGGWAALSEPTYPYDEQTDFQLPSVSAPDGLKAYLKAT